MELMVIAVTLYVWLFKIPSLPPQKRSGMPHLERKYLPFAQYK